MSTNRERGEGMNTRSPSGMEVSTPCRVLMVLKLRQRPARACGGDGEVWLLIRPTMKVGPIKPASTISGGGGGVMNKLIATIVCISMLVSMPAFACTGAGSGAGGSAGGASADGGGSGASGGSGSASAGDSGSSGDGSGGVGLVNNTGERKARYMPDCDSFENFLNGKCR